MKLADASLSQWRYSRVTLLACSATRLGRTSTACIGDERHEIPGALGSFAASPSPAPATGSRNVCRTGRQTSLRPRSLSRTRPATVHSLSVCRYLLHRKHPAVRASHRHLPVMDVRGLLNEPGFRPLAAHWCRFLRHEAGGRVALRRPRRKRLRILAVGRHGNAVASAGAPVQMALSRKNFSSWHGSCSDRHGRSNFSTLLNGPADRLERANARNS